MKLSFLLIATILIISTVLILPQQSNAISNDEVKQKIITAINKDVEGNWSSIDLFNISRFDSNTTTVVWNQTNTTTPAPTCPPNTHLENNICIPNEEPPQPTENTTKVIVVGDPSGIEVRDAIKKQNADLVVADGDLGYKSDLSWYKSNYKDLAELQRCVIGNHDSKENGNAAIEQEAIALCGESWNLKIGKTLFMGFNTNGNLDTQLGEGQSLLMNDQFMNGIVNVHIFTHKPCVTPPNSHHPVETEVKTFCDRLIAKAPESVKIFLDAGHNHVMAQTADGLNNEVGSGGKSHYTCGTNAVWTFCNNSHYGFLEYVIDNNSGETVSHFKDTDGKIIH